MGLEHGVILDFARPGKPTDNALIELFNSNFRDECLNTHWFLSLDDARQKIEDWRRHYNRFRTLGNSTPERACQSNQPEQKTLDPFPTIPTDAGNGSGKLLLSLQC